MQKVRSIQVSGEKFAKIVDDSMLSQDGFARAVGVSRNLIHLKSKPGVHSLDLSVVQKIAGFLHIPPKEFAEKVHANGEAAPAEKVSRVLADLSALVASGALTTGKVMEVTERAAAKHKPKE